MSKLKAADMKRVKDHSGHNRLHPEGFYFAPDALDKALSDLWDSAYQAGSDDGYYMSNRAKAFLVGIWTWALTSAVAGYALAGWLSITHRQSSPNWVAVVWLGGGVLCGVVAYRVAYRKLSR